MTGDIEALRRTLTVRLAKLDNQVARIERERWTTTSPSRPPCARMTRRWMPSRIGA